MSVKGAVAIIGAAETERIGTVPELSALELHADAARRAVADAGLTMADVDGVASAGHSPTAVAHYLGVTPTYIDGTMVGGCSYLLHVRHAAAAIAAGSRTSCSSPTASRAGHEWAHRLGSGPLVAAGPVRAPVRHDRATHDVPDGRAPLHEGDGTHPRAARVGGRRAAALVVPGPRAKFRDLITVDDVFASPMIAYPMHLLECCLVTDGGGALVVTSADRARAMPGPKPPVYVLGTGEASETPMVSMMEDFTSSKAFRLSSSARVRRGGLGPRDIDHLMIYDAFAHLPIYGLEDLGFVGRGEAGAFIEEGHTSPGGRLPLNTNGGGLSYTHTGMYGMFLILESVRQLRGEAPAQVPDVEVSLAQGVGGMFMAAGTLILGTGAAAGA
jgi:acetyl-CoA acetyltransferase